ncbi:hypothetical protein R1sor_022303 [Riccia sorocarpa]|uniref:Reverse transcriptase domain-containing protein n=1 Tax=Riccia sorocarpa TaxID=122646 RepID=A0ABD3GLF6_9MARC
MVGATATIFADGYASSLIQIRSGVRQGCPLAPLLFAIATVPLIYSVHRAVQHQQLTPAIEVNGQPIIISLYADDVTLFLPWQQEAFSSAMQLLQQFCAGTNSRINAQKTEFMSIGEDKPLPGWMADLGWRKMERHMVVRYLGFPFSPAAPSSQMWALTFDKISARLKHWEDQYITFEGRVILLKVVLAAIPQYIAMFQKLQLPHLRQLNRLFSNFLWGHNQQDSKSSSIFLHEDSRAAGTGCQSAVESALGDDLDEAAMETMVEIGIFQLVRFA